MIDGQTNIFEMLYPTYKITKPIRLIELFAGYGSQALALKYLGVEFEHWKICEWAVKSIQAYKDIHFPNCYEIGLFNTKDEMVDYLYNKGISSDYNEPMSKKQIERLSWEQLDTICGNIEITNNLVNIQQVKGKDLEATDGDGIDISSRMEHHRGNVQKDKIQTLTTSGGNDRGVVENLRIRKLTPRECFRLQGVKDEDFDKVRKNQSDSSLYHLAGDSIVVNVLMAIFKEMIE